MPSKDGSKTINYTTFNIYFNNFQLVNLVRLTARNVRENGMDMTIWLDYFTTGLETQMVEVKDRGEQVIRRDVLVQKHSLNDRQGKAIEFLLAHGKLTIQDYEKLCPKVNRRSLQRDLKGMQDKDLVTTEGATNQLAYVLRV